MPKPNPSSTIQPPVSLSPELRTALSRFSSFSHDLSLVMSLLHSTLSFSSPPIYDQPMRRSKPTPRSAAWREAREAAAAETTTTVAAPSVSIPPGRREVLRHLILGSGAYVERELTVSSSEESGDVCDGSDEPRSELSPSHDSDHSHDWSTYNDSPRSENFSDISDNPADDSIRDIDDVASSVSDEVRQVSDDRPGDPFIDYPIDYDWDRHHARLFVYVKSLAKRGLQCDEALRCECVRCQVAHRHAVDESHHPTLEGPVNRGDDSVSGPSCDDTSQLGSFDDEASASISCEDQSDCENSQRLDSAPMSRSLSRSAQSEQSHRGVSAFSNSPQPFREILVDTDGNEMPNEEDSFTKESYESEMVNNLDDDHGHNLRHSDYDVPPHFNLDLQQTEDEDDHCSNSQSIQSLNNQSDQLPASDRDQSHFDSSHLNYDRPPHFDLDHDPQIDSYPSEEDYDYDAEDD